LYGDWHHTTLQVKKRIVDFKCGSAANNGTDLSGTYRRVPGKLVLQSLILIHILNINGKMNE
jgi:hypothetical protein